MNDYAVVLAADLPSASEVAAMVKRVGSVVDGIKIGEAALLEAGADIIARIKDLVPEKPILLDLKIADIGFASDKGWQGTNAKIIHAVAGKGVTHITAHGFPGPLSIAEAVSAAREADIGVLLLPLMSHAGAGLFFKRPLNFSELKYSLIKTGLDVTLTTDLPCEDVTDGILILGESLDVAGYIGPATRPADLERYRALTSKPVWCPGFGRQDRQGRSLEEQLRQWARIVGKKSAAIVGSLIFNAADPLRAAQEVIEMRDKATDTSSVS